MNNQLKRLRDQVALEAYAVSDLSGLVSRIIPTVLGSLESFKGMFTPAPAVALTSAQKPFLKDVIAKRTYPTLMPLTAFVPEGMKKTYLEYAGALVPAVSHTSGVSPLIDEFSLFLSMLVNNKEAVIETSSRKKLFTEISKRREEVNADVQRCFDNSTRTSRRVEDVVKRNSDWASVFEIADNLSRKMNEIERSHLNKKVEECTAYIQTVQKHIGEGRYEHVSPEVILDLADGAYQVASELEFYSIMYYRVQAFNSAVDRTVDYVTKVVSETGPA